MEFTSSWDVSLFFPLSIKKIAEEEKKKESMERDKEGEKDEREREEEKDCIVLLYEVRRADYAIGYLAMMVETKRERWMKRQIKKGHLEARAKNLLSGLRDNAT